MFDLLIGRGRCTARSF